jgi:hypothetical protein
MHLIHFL